MNFSFQKSREILERTPAVLRQLLEGLSDEWIHNNEGAETWSPFDVVGHLIHAELTDWLVRAEIILSEGGEKTFPPFDRFAQFESSKGKTLDNLLTEFEQCRKINLQRLDAYQLTEQDLQKTGNHPVLGEVTLSHLLSTWVAHDLDHIVQICRVMAKQYNEAVGPWKQFLKVLHQ